MSSSNVGPLDGVRIVELATVLMAPYATQILGDMGADVVKVESDRLDTGRMLGAGPHPELSGVSLNLLRNKRSIQLDLKSDGGRDALFRLLSTADVFVTNLRPSTLRKLGLDYDAISERFAHLLYCEAHGFRIGTPEEDRPAFDDVVQAESGLPLLAEATGDRVAFLPTVIADKVAGLFVGQAILGALVRYVADRKGQRIEVPMFDSVLAFNFVEHLGPATVPGNAAGYQRLLTRHRGPHRTADGYLALLPYSDADWRAIFTAAGAEDELAEPEYASVRARHGNPDKVYARLAELIGTKTTAQWVQIASRAGVPFGLVPSMQELADDPVLNRGVLTEAEHPHIGPYRQIRPPINYSRTPASVRRAAPLVGENTEEILHEAGYTRTQIDELIASGAASQSVETARGAADVSG